LEEDQRGSCHEEISLPDVAREQDLRSREEQEQTTEERRSKEERGKKKSKVTIS
jgi:hypothetical protein